MPSEIEEIEAILREHIYATHGSTQCGRYTDYEVVELGGVSEGAQAISSYIAPILAQADTAAQAVAENDRLRASLANSGSPCAYCNLPREDWSKCASGFPGCVRADDAMLCPHVGAELETADKLEIAQAEVARLSAEVERLRATNRDLHRRTQKAERFRVRHNGSFIHLIKRRLAESRVRRAAEAEVARLTAEVAALRSERDGARQEADNLREGLATLIAEQVREHRTALAAGQDKTESFPTSVPTPQKDRDHG